MMNYSNRTIIFFLMLFVASTGIVTAQRNFRAEQNFIERVYKKLSLYQSAQKRHDRAKKGKPVKDEDLLRFTISNIRSGPINEILNKQVISLATLPSGRVLRYVEINSNHVHYKKNGTKIRTEKFGVDVKWANGHYSSIADPKTTLGEVLKMYADNYPNNQ